MEYTQKSWENINLLNNCVTRGICDWNHGVFEIRREVDPVIRVSGCHGHRLRDELSGRAAVREQDLLPDLLAKFCVPEINKRSVASFCRRGWVGCGKLTCCMIQ